MAYHVAGFVETEAEIENNGALETERREDTEGRSFITDVNDQELWAPERVVTELGIMEMRRKRRGWLWRMDRGLWSKRG